MRHIIMLTLLHGFWSAQSAGRTRLKTVNWQLKKKKRQTFIMFRTKTQKFNSDTSKTLGGCLRWVHGVQTAPG